MYELFFLNSVHTGYQKAQLKNTTESRLIIRGDMEFFCCQLNELHIKTGRMFVNKLKKPIFGCQAYVRSILL